MQPATPENMDVGFVLICAALVFLMQSGFCMLESGMIRAKNSINVAVKNLLDFGLSMMVFAAFGFSIMFGDSNFGLFGSYLDFWSNNDLAAFFLFQMVFCGTAATIVSGAVAERTRLSTYLFIVIILSGFVYPVVGHWCWGGLLQNTGSGWLSGLGFVDWAGTAVVHLTGGFAALAAIMAIGPRRNYKRSKLTGGHSLTLAIMGCFLLWFGWWGFNGGSGLNAEDNVSIVLLNTNLGAVAGLIAASIWSLRRTQKTNVVDLISGTLAGLVSVTGACHAISPLAAIASGAVGGIIALWAIEFIRNRGADDAVGAFGVHGAAGLWGTMVFAIFAPTELLPTGGRLSQLLIQSTGAVAVSLTSFITIYGSLRLMKMFTRLRVKAGEEKTGLNVVEHGATNEVTDLLGAMNFHRQTGDFSTKIETDTDTEVGQIASEYNAVLTRVNEEVVGHESTNRILQGEKLRLQSVLEHAGVGIYQMDEGGKFQSANPTLLQIFGYPSASALIDQEDSFSIPWHADNKESLTKLANSFESGQKITNLETKFEDRSGQTRWLLESIVPIRDEHGCLVSWLGTVHDVTERKQAMLAEVEVAEAKSAAKGEFLANMSHEIRTPLNGVIGMLDLLSTGTLDHKSENYVNVARSSADTLLSVINDILDFSKIEAGKLELEQVDFDLRELMESSAEQFAIRAHSKGLEMNCKLASDLPHIVKGDPERLRQAIINLMGNAIKFTESGEINLCVSRRGSVIHFSVQDTGIGIAEDAQEHLFESFVQADVSTTRRYGGTGLGLTIVSQLVQLMGGNLKVDSAIDQGSDFWFELPMDVVEEELPRKKDLSDTLAGLAHCNVLVVDDNATNCEILENQLACWGMSSTICRESTAVVQKALVAKVLERPFDLIILDFCMPEMDGRDVAIELKNHPELATIPIIMLSSNRDLMTKAELQEAGIEIAMTKPARQSRLFDSIVSLVYKDRMTPSAVADETNSTDGQNTNSDALQNNVPSETKPDIASVTEPVLPGTNTYTADVLIAEDNQVNQIVVQQLLESLGYTSALASDGESALQQVKAGKFGMILMDGHMPRMDGLTAARAIRDWEAQQLNLGKIDRPTPIVALTANVVAGFRQRCLDAGMDDYLCKPITLARLQDAAENYLGPPRQPAPKPSEPTPVIAGDLEPQNSDTQLNKARTEASPPIESSQGNRSPATSENVPTVTIDRRKTANDTTHSTPNASPRTADSMGDSSNEDEQQKYFDPAALSERCGGNVVIQNQLLNIMRETMPERLVELQYASTQNDLTRVRSIAHQLKGAAGDTSLVAVCESAAKLEHCVNENQVELIPMTLFELESRIQGTLRKLQKYLDQE